MYFANYDKGYDKGLMLDTDVEAQFSIFLSVLFPSLINLKNVAVMKATC